MVRTETTSLWPSLSSQLATKSGSTLVSLAYHYATQGVPTADLGKVQWEKDSVAGATTYYAYDDLGRLTCATSAASGSCASTGLGYNFDADGNITSRIINGTTADVMTYDSADESTNTNETYNGAGDEKANLFGTTMTYNTQAQTASVQVAGSSPDPYSYTGTGQDGLTATGSTVVQNSQLLGVTAITATSTTAFTRDPSGTLVSMRTGSKNYYYLLDAQSSVVGLVSSTGSLAAGYTYDPWGSVTNTPTGVGATNPFRFDSGYMTPEGLYHFGVRFYNPSTGRWTQLDPSGKNSGYVFAGDDPVNANDPSGLDVFTCGIISCTYYLSTSNTLNLENFIVTRGPTTALAEGAALAALACYPAGGFGAVVCSALALIFLSSVIDSTNSATAEGGCLTFNTYLSVGFVPSSDGNCA